MERLPIATVGVHECDDGLHHKVDRNDVGAAGVGQHDRGESGQYGQLRQQAEEVVRAVDLVHLAGAGIADHDRGPVYPVAQSCRRADQQLRLELRLVIRRRQILRDVEVVLGELAVVGACDGDRRHMMQRGVQPTGQVDHRAGALHVGRLLVGLLSGDVVDRRAMHDVVDGAQLGDGLVGEVEVRRGEVPDQRFRPLSPRLVALGGEPLEPGQRLPSHQHPHFGVIVTGQDLRHHPAADKPGTAGNDITHASHGHRSPRKGQPRPTASGSSPGCGGGRGRSPAGQAQQISSDSPTKGA